MHTALTRANALAAYTMSVLASLTFLCFLSTFFNEYQVIFLFFLVGNILLDAYDEKPSILNIDHNENYYPEPDQLVKGK